MRPPYLRRPREVVLLPGSAAGIHSSIHALLLRCLVHCKLTASCIYRVARGASAFNRFPAGYVHAATCGGSLLKETGECCISSTVVINRGETGRAVRTSKTVSVSISQSSATIYSSESYFDLTHQVYKIKTALYI